MPSRGAYGRAARMPRTSALPKVPYVSISIKKVKSSILRWLFLMERFWSPKEPTIPRLQETPMPIANIVCSTIRIHPHSWWLQNHYTTTHARMYEFFVNVSGLFDIFLDLLIDKRKLPWPNLRPGQFYNQRICFKSSRSLSVVDQAVAKRTTVWFWS